MRHFQKQWTANCYQMNTEEFMLLNCGVGKDSWESLGCKEIKPVHPKGNQSWVFIGKTDAEAEAPILWPPDAKSWLIWKDPDAGKDRGQEEMGTKGWDGWMASPTRRTWVWVNSRSWWWTGKPGMLQSMGSQGVRHDWVTELNWTEVGHNFSSKEQVSFNFMASVTICSDFGVQENKVCHCFHCFPIYMLWNVGTRCHDLHFLNVEF